MRDNYIKLIDFIFGKYMYTVMRNNDRILYFEVVNNKYVEPIYSFNLYDNEGKSLTSVNEHFFMNQLVNRINVACKKGIFISDQEIVEYLNKVKSSCGDPELKKLFKGSYMSEINEFYFENNKRSILRYLDKFKYDTFVDYNNVSIFNGSLEKNGNQSVADVNLDVSNESVETNDVVNNEPVVESIDDSVESIDVVDDSDSTTTSNNIDFMNIPVDNSLGDVVNSSDYFSNQISDNSSQNVEEVIENNDVQNVTSNDMVQDVVDDIIDESSVVSNQDNVVQSVDNVQQNADLTAPLDFNSLYSNNSSQPVVENNEQAVVDNVQNAQQNADLTAPLDFNSLYSNNSSQPVVQNNEQAVVDNVQNAQQNVDLTAPLDFNSLYSNNGSQPVVQNNEQPVVENVQQNVDLTAPLDFNSLYSNNSSQPVVENSVVSDNIQMVPNTDFSSSTLNTISNEANGISNDGQHVQPIDLNESPNVQFSNDGFSLAEPLVENAVDSNLNNNNVMYSEQVSAPSYITEVKDRLQNNAFNTELGVMSPNVTESDLDKTVVVDKVSMPPLESVADEGSKKPKKKKSFGVVIFIIILLLVLAGFAYFLYNYIF